MSNSNQQETERHWLAGVFDSEGSVGVEKQDRKNVGPHFYLSMKIYNKDFAIINKARKILVSDEIHPYLFEDNKGVASLTIRKISDVKRFIDVYTHLVQTKKPQMLVANKLAVDGKNVQHWQRLKDLNEIPKKDFTKFDLTSPGPELDWWWLAGFLEGDGSISMNKTKGNNRYYYYPRVTLHNTHYGTIERIKTIFDREMIEYSCSSVDIKDRRVIWQIGVGSGDSVIKVLGRLEGKLFGGKEARRESMLDYLMSKKSGSSEN